MKKILLILNVIISTTLFSQTFIVDNIEYTVIEDVNLSVTKYLGSGGDVNIPVSITNNGITYSVTEIGDNAFENDNFPSISLTNITIPDGVVSIGSRSFFGNDLLTSAILPEGLTSIGYQAFFLSGLTEIVIPDSVIDIGAIAFTNNELTSLIIPANVTSIGSEAFTGNQFTKVTSLSNAPANLTNLTGFGVFSGIDLIIPPGSRQAYIDANWTPINGVNTITEDAVLSNQQFNLNDSISLQLSGYNLTILNANHKLLRLKIYNLLGEEVISSKKNEVKLDNLAKGIYILRANFDDGMVAKKFTF